MMMWTLVYLQHPVPSFRIREESSWENRIDGPSTHLDKLQRYTSIALLRNKVRKGKAFNQPPSELSQPSKVHDRLEPKRSE
mmetsp:Transcript_17711/g.40865  ORF Transcript_17711/g.40865 Transcript_17711/m.40865 type:complete len:81 (-) Transcript_17711:4-246(-)